MSVARVGCTESVHPCLTRGTETVHVAENGWVTVRKKLGFWRGSPLSGGEGGLPEEGRYNDPQDPAVAEPERSQT